MKNITKQELSWEQALESIIEANKEIETYSSVMTEYEKTLSRRDIKSQMDKYKGAIFAGVIANFFDAKNKLSMVLNLYGETIENLLK